MTEIKKVNNLEELRLVKSGEIIGVGQAITATIPAKCESNDGKNIILIGNMDNKVMVKYNFVIDSVEGFYDDGSIRARMGNVEFVDELNKEFNHYKTFYEGGLK